MKTGISKIQVRGDTLLLAEEFAYHESLLMSDGTRECKVYSGEAGA